MAVNSRRLIPKRARDGAAGYYTPETYAAEDSIGYLIAATRTRLFRALDIELGKLGFTARNGQSCARSPTATRPSRPICAAS
jgi:hypothetical protein